MTQPTSDYLREMFGEPISVYTEDQAVDDGYLVEPCPKTLPGWLITRSIWDDLENAKAHPAGAATAAEPFMQDVNFACVAALKRHMKRAAEAGVVPSCPDLLILDRWMQGNATGRAELWAGPNGKPGAWTIFRPEER